MMQDRSALIGMVLVALGLVAPSSADAQATDVRLTTDRSIDCSSMETIARDLFRDKKTDEEKAIAAWYFVRRACYHWPKVPTWDTIDLINSYGFGLCGYQSTMFSQICLSGGIKTRLVYAPGHVLAEAYYGDAWHLFDCHIGWFAWRKDKSAVAGAAEMKADPTIITEAVKEGRASRPFFQCGDDPAGGVGWMAEHRVGGVPDVPARRLTLNLRRGESIIRNWQNEGKAWAEPGETTWTSPCHGEGPPCNQQTVDVNDPVNWPYWKPYAASRREGDRTVYGIKRAYGNGRMVYAPDLTTDAFREGLAKDGLQGVRRKAAGGRGPNVHPAEAGQAGSLIFVIEVPYVIVDAWVEGEFVRTGEEDRCRVLVSRDGKEWTQPWEAHKAGVFKSGAVDLKAAAWGQKRYFVKFEFRGQKEADAAGLNSFTITSVFVNNPQALPYLVPGQNEVRISTGSLGDRPLKVRYVWEEEGKEKAWDACVEKASSSFAIDVKGTELPRMKSLTLAVDP